MPGTLRWLPYTQGFYQLLTPADPPAATDFFITVTTGEIWLIVSVRCRYLASAVAGNRRPRLEFHPNAGTISYGQAASYAIAANQTVECYWSRGSSLQNTSTISLDAGGLMATCGIGDVYCHAGDFHINVSGKQAGDQLSTVHIQLLKWRLV